MSVALSPYLNFTDKTRQAMEFYKSVLGGELTLSTYKEFHASDDPSEDDKIMHAALVTDGINLMAADTPKRMEFKEGQNFSLSLTGTGDDEEKLRGYFEKLSDGGTVTMPLEKAGWGDIFGMCRDKFGISWMVNIEGKK